MGQDIHMHIEVKYRGFWEHYSAPAVARDYDLFGLLGSKRAPEGLRPVAGIQTGFPEDATLITKLCFEQDNKDYYGGIHPEDVHVLTSGESLQALQQAIYATIPDPRRYRADLEADILHCYIHGNALASHQGFEDVRLVYWFDN